MFKRSEQMKKNHKTLFSPRRFYTLYEQKFSNLRPLLSITFPQGFQKLNKKNGPWTLGSGKRPLNGVRNTNTKKSCSIWQNLSENKLFLRSDFTPFINISF